MLPIGIQENSALFKTIMTRFKAGRHTMRIYEDISLQCGRKCKPLA